MTSPVPLPCDSSLDTLLELVERRLVVAIKDSRGDIAATRALVEGTRNTPVRVLTGSELLADAALGFGADGIVRDSATSTHTAMSYRIAIRAGDVEAAAGGIVRHRAARHRRAAQDCRACSPEPLRSPAPQVDASPAERSRGRNCVVPRTGRDRPLLAWRHDSS